MSVYKCKMCGGELDITDNERIITCPYCGSSQSLPTFDSEKKLAYFSKANDLRFKKDFSKASYFYELITTEFPNEAEAYWCLVLCKFGIEYIDDGNKKVPTCHHMIYKSIFDDEDFKKAIQYSDVVSKEIYESEAEKINELQSKIIDSMQNEDYDIFICYKETDSDGNRTEDSVLAQRIYKLLVDENYKVFFSRISLEGKIGQEYEPLIYSALRSSKVLIHVTTSIKNTNSIWVKNEWERFLKNITKGKIFIPCYKNINVNELPYEMKCYQGLDFSKIGADQDLIHGISKYFTNKVETHKIVEKENVDTLFAIYQQRVNDLIEIDQFCSYSRDILPLINFFEDNIDYLDSQKYLIEAKYQYAKHIENYNDCIDAEEYLNEISPYKDSDDLLNYVLQKKNDFRHKDLVNLGFIIGIPKDCSVPLINEIIRSFIESVKLVNKTNDLSNDDLYFINDNHLKVNHFLTSNLLRLIQQCDDVNDLEKLKNNIDKLEKNTIGSNDIYSYKVQIENQIKAINLKIETEKKNKKKKKIRIIAIITAIILSIVGTITGIAISNKVNHSASRVSFKVTDKTQEYKSNVSPYVNGCYYIYFNYDIYSSSSVGISYMQFITYIKKDGKDIGSMKTSLDNMSLSPKSNKTYSIYLQDNQPEENGNTFFITLYNCNYSSLSFSFDILAINFSDGKYYFGDNYNKIY